MKELMSDSGKIVAAAMVNQVQADEYKNAKWTYDTAAQKVMVLLVIVPCLFNGIPDVQPVCLEKHL